MILDDKLQAKSENSKMLLLILRSLECILNEICKYSSEENEFLNNVE